MARRSVIWTQLGLLGAVIAAAVLTSRASDWSPVELVLLLAGLSLASDAVSIDARGQRLSGSFIALVLAMALLGPAPAAAIGLATILVDSARSRPALPLVVNNVLTYATFPLAGGLLTRWALDGGAPDHGIVFGLVVFGVFAATNLLNFLLIAVGRRVGAGHGIATQIRDIYIPVLPSEGMSATLAMGIALTYAAVGFAAMAGLVLVLVMFQVLTRELLKSQERAERLAVQRQELEDRTTQLASLQVGVLATLVQTLSLRDKMTARHSAAVARYARAIARAHGCSKMEQELVHTAGLLHDIGKFIFPDRILFADRRLTDEDWEIVKRHPAQGARLVSRVDGYGPVAEIIHSHHERIDGAGYPNGLRGEEIPLLSRMISIADTYDVMTARDSYRQPVPRAEAIAELRRVAGKQLDAELVEVFISLLGEENVAFRHTTDADFEAELDFEARVRALALTGAARVA